MFFRECRACFAASAASGNSGFFLPACPSSFSTSFWYIAGGDFHALGPAATMSRRELAAVARAQVTSGKRRRRKGGAMHERVAEPGGDLLELGDLLGCPGGSWTRNRLGRAMPLRGARLTASLAASMNSSMMRWAMLRGALADARHDRPVRRNRAAARAGRSRSRRGVMRRRLRMSASSLHQLEALRRAGVAYRRGPASPSRIRCTSV